MPNHKFVGIIIDDSYFLSYELEDKYNNIHTYKICKTCLEPVDLGFYEKGKHGGYAEAYPHRCSYFYEILKNPYQFLNKQKGEIK